MDGLIDLIILIVVLGAIAYIGYWAAGRLLPDPIRNVAQVIIVVIVALLFLKQALPMLGVSF